MLLVLGNGSSEDGSLLNAYLTPPNSITDAMLPDTFYFLEFPTDVASEGKTLPMCADQSPYSFMFRRGKKYTNKLIVEFEGGSACWEGSCSCDATTHARTAPWHDYYSSTFQQMALPWIGSCHGIIPGFVKELKGPLFRNTNTTSDIPTCIRGDGWPALDDSSFDDWSYLLLPHCTMDWHLGYQEEGRESGCELEDDGGAWWDSAQGEERIWHRGGANMDAVLDWLIIQYPDGLDAMLTFSGGQMGGCNDKDPETASSIAPAVFATEAASSMNMDPSSILAILDGGSLQNPNLPYNSVLELPWNPRALTATSSILQDVQDLVVNAPLAVEFAWIASTQANSNDEEKKMLLELAQQRPGQFHIYVPPNDDDSSLAASETCPRFAFPETQDYSNFAPFFKDIVSDMSWEASSPQEEITLDSLVARNSGVSRLSFLSIAVLALGLWGLVWLIYFGVKHHRTKNNNLAKIMSPNELWLHALTHYPAWFLLFSVTLPITLSVVAFAQSGYTINVNLDFQSYLDISSDLEVVAKTYSSVKQYQRESVDEATDQCDAILGNGNRRSLLLEGGNYDRILQEEDEEELARATVSIIYQNRNGGNVFSPEVLDSIYEFEESIRNLPDFETYCRLKEEECRPFDSVLSFLYPNGELVGNIEQVLFAEAKNSQVDQYFGPFNLQSNITRSVMFFQGPQPELNRFLEYLYRDVFWERDQSGFYPNMVFTWRNGFMLRLEASDALFHDTLWSLGSLLFIGLMILLKVQDVFEFFFGILGLLLAFTTSYYWCLNHFAIPEITLLHVSGLFVMLGIGADDIFLMIDSYEHAKVELEQEELDGDQPLNLEKVRRRMLWAYSTAGGMMLVSSLTAAVCFFSNAFGVLLVIQEFGIYMGMVVLINFFNVMTILPSAILVNEIYIKPWKRKFFSYICCCSQSKNTDRGTTKLDSLLGMVDSDLGKPQDAAVGNSGNILVAGNETGEDGMEMTLNPQSQDKASTDNSSKGISGNRMNRTDSWLLGRYAPFLIRRRVPILVVSALFAVLLGIFGILNLEFTDGSIVIFSNKFNQGRLTSVQVRHQCILI